jgi:hypothetical protein
MISPPFLLLSSRIASWQMSSSPQRTRFSPVIHMLIPFVTRANCKPAQNPSEAESKRSNT